MRRARVDQDCEVCSLPISAGDEIRGADLGGGTMRWVHPSCCPGHEPTPTFTPPPSTPPPPVAPERQRASLAWARQQLNRMRAGGWTGDDAAMLRALRIQHEADA